MAIEDVGACVEVFRAALDALRVSLRLAPIASRRLDGGVAHLLETDPGGSFVAREPSGAIVGFAQAARRDSLWILAHLFIDPARQGAGIGRALLACAHSYGANCTAGLIAATPTPPALRLYGQLPGFVLHPMLTAAGEVDHARLSPSSLVREANENDLELAAELGRSIRGGAHGPDLLYLVQQGGTLLVADDRGYAVAAPAGPELVAATDPEAANALLVECLRRTAPGTQATVKRIGAGQPWAIETSLLANLALRPWGPLVARGTAAPTAAYLADSAFC